MRRNGCTASLRYRNRSKITVQCVKTKNELFFFYFPAEGWTLKLQFKSHLFLTWESIFCCIGNTRTKAGGPHAVGTAARKGYVFYY